MTSQTDPRKLKALLRDSQAVIPEADEDDEEATGADGSDGADEEEDTGDEGEAEGLTVESLAESFKPAVPTINEIIDEFRQGTDAQPEAGIEQLEEDRRWWRCPRHDGHS